MRPVERLAYSALGILGGVSNAGAQRFLSDATDARLLVFGYAGLDVDVYPLLREAIPLARTVRWYVVDDQELPRVRRDLVQRYGLSPGDGSGDVERCLVVSENPGKTLYSDLTREDPD